MRIHLRSIVGNEKVIMVVVEEFEFDQDNLVRMPKHSDRGSDRL
ncbi:hypothetical protein [Gracilibacillus saliphilus]|nr:hypothetical protein [Gracilibacillus saliphilus]